MVLVNSNYFLYCAKKKIKTPELPFLEADFLMENLLYIIQKNNRIKLKFRLNQLLKIFQKYSIKNAG